VLCSNYSVVGQEIEVCAKNGEEMAQWSAARPQLWPADHEFLPHNLAQFPLWPPFPPKACGDARLYFHVP
jgi:hypothetical protein